MSYNLPPTPPPPTPREYNGEQRVRYSVADIKPLDYASESRRLLGLIQAA